mmetsp:Transcript_20853/g.35830  ORF Transcript_20853/g.35830 Transcript_20853/m.35830 type:complete len:337 (-) Transcript_20853:51-1061(-)
MTQCNREERSPAQYGKTFLYTGQDTEVPKDIVSVNVSPSVKEIPRGAFAECRALKYAILHEGLQTIGDRAFFDCASLERIEVPSTMIGYRAFSFCIALRSVALNEGLRAIGTEAFSDCNSLERIEFPSSVIAIGDRVFHHCVAMREVMLNEGLGGIGVFAFYGCYSLECITLPSTLVHIIGTLVSLEDLPFDEALEKIVSYVFDNCLPLKSVKCGHVRRRLESICCDKSRKAILKSINELPGISMVDGDFLCLTYSQAGWSTTMKSLAQICGMIACCELRDAATVFELALWKINMAAANIVDDASRESFRVDVPGPVKDAVLQFFRKSNRANIIQQ